MGDVSQELVERMIALVREVSNPERTVAEARAMGTEARAIVAELPAPVDPDLAFMREVYAAERQDRFPEIAHSIRRGRMDTDLPIKVGLMALKRREIERAGK